MDRERFRSLETAQFFMALDTSCRRLSLAFQEPLKALGKIRKRKRQRLLEFVIVRVDTAPLNDVDRIDRLRLQPAALPDTGSWDSFGWFTEHYWSQPTSTSPPAVLTVLGMMRGV